MMFTIDKQTPWGWDETAFRFTDKAAARTAAKNLEAAEPNRDVRVRRIGDGGNIVFCRRTIRNSQCGGIDLSLEGRYEVTGWGYILREWRLTTVLPSGQLLSGKWHKVHGGQKKDLGVLKLVRDLKDGPPPVDPWLEYNTEEVVI
jgi:hypothetical protein